MAKITHTSRDSNTSRPRELLERRTSERLLKTAEQLGIQVRKRITRGELIELLTTDDPIVEEVEEEEDAE